MRPPVESWVCSCRAAVIKEPIFGVLYQCTACGDASEWKDDTKSPGVVEAIVNHPQHYGGADNSYETIKVIEAWGLGFNLGNCVKYVSRAGKKGDLLTDLKKAEWYLKHEIAKLESAK